MKLALFTILLVSIFPASVAWAQYLPPDNTLTVQVLSPYSYKADDGTTVVLGEVQNKNNFPVANVKIGVTFYDDKDKILEFKTGTTLLKVVPSGGKIPFSISSTKPDPNITRVQVNLAGFNSSPSRQQLLNITPGTMEISDKLILSGTVTNTGTILSTETNVYLVSYDSFTRVVDVATAELQTNDITAGKTSNFNITSKPNSDAKSYKLIAESDQYQSRMVDVTSINIALNSLAKIEKVSVTDPDGNKYSTIPVGGKVVITNEISKQYGGDQSVQPYVCYVQIKRFGGAVEFIGSAQGVFVGTGKQTPTVTWVPESEGQFFVEVYVWDPNFAALSTPSLDINVLLVKSQ